MDKWGRWLMEILLLFWKGECDLLIYDWEGLAKWYKLEIWVRRMRTTLGIVYVVVKE